MLSKIKNYIRLKTLKIANAHLILTQEIFVKDSKGKILYHNKKVGNSAVANFLYILYIQFAAESVNYASPPDAQNTLGSNITGSYNSAPTLNPDSGDDSFGMLFGSGNASPLPADYKITEIMNGITAGTLSYFAQQAIQAPTVSGNNTSFVLSRSALNSSGAAININEIGIYVVIVGSVCMIYRDLTGLPLSVPNGSTFTANITFSITT
jgi:hypothetical protein